MPIDLTRWQQAPDEVLAYTPRLPGGAPEVDDEQPTRWYPGCRMIAGTMTALWRQRWQTSLIRSPASGVHEEKAVISVPAPLSVRQKSCR